MRSAPDTDDYVPIHDEFDEAGIDIYATPIDKLMDYENLGHNVARAMEHPDDLD